jgi:lysophospholipase L1-like esterase
MPTESTRAGAGPSWPLRVGLGLCVTALVIVGFQLKDAHRSPAATPTTTLRTTPTTTTASGPTTTNGASSTTTPTTQPSPPSPPVTNLPPPYVNMAAFKPPGAGCRFSTGAPNPSTSDDTTTTNATSTTTTVPAVTAIGRCTVLEIGDSLGNDLGWGMARQLGHDHAVRLVQADKSSSGLLTPWFYDWAKKEKVLLAQYKPQLVIITFGANDEQNLKAPNGDVLAFGSAPWVTAYTGIVTKMATAATKTGAYVLWIGMPIMQPNGYRQGMVLINSVFAKVATTVPGMTFLPTWDLFANAKGQFVDAERVNNIPSLLREADGIHFSYVGENVFATFVTRSIGDVFHVQITPEAAMYVDR